ncbi:MAG: hypothetical protein AAF517_23255, partial [Planctomycetota bacterium]
MSEQFAPSSYWGKGCVAEFGSSSFRHVFGGERWSVRGALDHICSPVLLACIDLCDPQLEVGVLPASLGELPLCGYFNIDGLTEQKYKLRPASKHIELV